MAGIRPQHKYVRVCEGTIRVKLERGSRVIIERFHIRRFSSFDSAMLAALKWRDDKHMEIFGIPVPNNIIHITPRTSRKNLCHPDTGEKLPELPPGLSYGIFSGVLRYIVVSHQVNGKPVRKRFNIKELGIDVAISSGVEQRRQWETVDDSKK